MNNKKIPITLDNLDKLINSIPLEEFEKARKKCEKRMAESRKFWEDKAKDKI